MAKKQSKAKATAPKKTDTATAWDVYAQRKGECVYLGLFTDKTKALQYAESKGHHRSVVSFVERKAAATQSGENIALTISGADLVSAHAAIDRRGGGTL